MTTVAISQSNYIPWKGYFDIIHDVDLFVFYDCVQFTKRDWRTRNKVKTQNGTQWLSVPVNATRESRICDVHLVTGDDWATKHLRTLHHTYGKTPHWHALEGLLSEIYGRTWPSLSEMNQAVTERIARDWLGIETELVDSRRYEAVGHKTDRILDILQKTRATRYVSGPSARGYLEEERFTQLGIELVYKDYGGYPEYTQPYPPFDHFVTILDLLACVGRDDAAKYVWGWRT